MQHVTTINRPHQLDPTRETCRVVFTAKNFAAVKGVCHIGLVVTATNTAKVLRRQGIFAEVWPTQTYEDLQKLLVKAEAESKATGKVAVSHCIVSAPSWIQPDQFNALCHEFPDITFVLLNHSGAAFLSIDKYGIRNIRECCDLALSLHNMKVAANNTRVVGFIEKGIGADCLYLPNLYDTHSFKPYTHRMPGDTIRIGSFGAGRPWKNQLTAAEAGVMLAKQLGLQLEFYVNSKRPDGGERMVESRLELFDGLRGAKMIEVPWERWPRFRHTCSTMHLLLQPSFDETFNVVTADGIAMGIPSVTSPSIEWTPQRWWSNTCDPHDLVKVGLYLLNDKYCVDDARKSLTDYVGYGVSRWEQFLLSR